MRYLVISFLHPRIVRGGCQQIAYELFEGASNDTDMQAHFVAAIDPALPNANTPPGAIFTGIDGKENENILISYNFDVEYHVQTNWYVIEKLSEFFAKNTYDWVHFHHSLFVGLDVLEVVKRYQPKAKIFYTLHEYLPICLADGQMKKTYNKALCHDPSPSACFKCFPKKSVDFFFLRNRLFREKFKLVDHFITPSRFARDRFVEWGIPADRISVIPNGQKNLNPQPDKPPRFRKAKAKGEATRFAFFGQMIDNKGAHLIIEAAEILDRMREKAGVAVPPFEVHFYGGNVQFASEAYRKKIEDALEKSASGTTRAFVFHGEYVHEQLPAIFESIDCVITPSTWSEVFGLVVSEAWMFHTPVIASDIGGLSERIIEGENGLKFRPSDAHDLARVMLTYMMDYALKGRAFNGIEPPMTQEGFWQAHKKLFSTEQKTPVAKKAKPSLSYVT